MNIRLHDTAQRYIRARAGCMLGTRRVHSRSARACGGGGGGFGVTREEMRAIECHCVYSNFCYLPALLGASIAGSHGSPPRLGMHYRVVRKARSPTGTGTGRYRLSLFSCLFVFLLVHLFLLSRLMISVRNKSKVSIDFIPSSRLAATRPENTRNLPLPKDPCDR